MNAIFPAANEDELQIQMVNWLRCVLRPGVMFWHTPNGGSRNVCEASKMKAMGVLAGITDLIFLWRTEDSAGHARYWLLFVEVKMPGGRYTASQKEVMPRLQAMGAPVETARSIDDLQTILSRHDVPCRARW